MNLAKCVVCNKNKTALRCESCADPTCKQCSYFIDEDSFAMVPLLPEKLKNKTFCSNCYNQDISEEMELYQDIFEKAKQVDVYGKDQSKETRLIKRIEPPVTVQGCEDQEETLLRLAFLAAEKGYSTIVDTHIKHVKVGEGKAYKKLIWNGSAIPVDPNIKK